MDLEFDNIDQQNIEKAKAEGGKVWENEILQELKKKIKSYYRETLKEQCCYCRKNFDGEFDLVIDIEHILPKSKFKDLMFNLKNLSISCKRCNMKIKKDDVSFLENIDEIKVNFEDSSLYRFIHPNFDNYFSHLKNFTVTFNNKKIIKYQVVPQSSKGQYTYDYFRLNELEVDSINEAQGLEKSTLSNNVSTEITDKITELLKLL